MTKLHTRILLVEDHDSDAQLLCQMLSGIDTGLYQILRADTLKDGMDQCRRPDIDVILLDLGLPDSQGMDTVTAFLSCPPPKPVVIMTGINDEQIAARAVQMGVQNFLVKGQTSATVLSWILRDAITRFETEKKFQLLVTQNADAILIVSRDGEVVFANPAAEILFKKRWGDLKGTVFGFPVDTNAISEVDINRADGTLAVAEIRAADIIWKDSDAILLTIRDVTDRKKLEAELAQARKMEALGLLAGGVAHDFNNIMMVILGYAELSRDQAKEGSDLMENLEKIRQAGQRAQQIVEQILTFTRQARGEFKPVRITPVVKEAIQFLKQSLPGHITVVETIESDARIMGDPAQIHQIVMNICTNAVHAMETDGTLSVSLKDIIVEESDCITGEGMSPGTYIELKITDTGTGIPPHIIGEIFQPYFTTKCVGKGSGLGLAVVHGIVEHYKGKIRVESRAGLGSQFTVYLPALPA